VRSFLKKEPKNFYPFADTAPTDRRQLDKVFLLLFVQKKKIFLLRCQINARSPIA